MRYDIGYTSSSKAPGKQSFRAPTQITIAPTDQVRTARRKIQLAVSWAPLPPKEQSSVEISTIY